MNESDWVVRYALGDVVAAAPVGGCRLEFRKQRGTGQLWCVGSGPLGIMAWPVMDAEGVAHASRLAASDPRIGVRSRARYAKWQQVRINDDLLIAIRARGSDLELVYLLGDGRPFGGGRGWLPTARPATLLGRAQMWLSGRRGPRVSYARHVDEGTH